MKEVVERLAEHMAITFNGGQWAIHYTEKQKDLWRTRVRLILAGTDWKMG